MLTTCSSGYRKWQMPVASDTKTTAAGSALAAERHREPERSERGAVAASGEISFRHGWEEDRAGLPPQSPTREPIGSRVFRPTLDSCLLCDLGLSGSLPSPRASISPLAHKEGGAWTLPGTVPVLVRCLSNPGTGEAGSDVGTRGTVLFSDISSPSKPLGRNGGQKLRPLWQIVPCAG